MPLADRPDRLALDQLFSVTYEELRRLASSVRRGDPSATLSPTALVNEAWLLPLPETALRRQIERAFLEASAPLPRNVIESISILTNRVLLRKSDCIGVLPYHVALDDVEHGLLSVLPVKLKSIESPVGAIVRAPGNLPPAASALLECLRIAARDVPSPRLSRL